MKNIFLNSFMANATDAFEDFIKNYEAKEIVFIPTASHTEKHRDYVYRAWSYFESLGFKCKDFEVSEFSKDDCQKMLAEAEILYVAGGNTFYLLQELKKKDLVEPIRKKVEEGMVYIGESAGAVITSHDIDYIHLLDPKEEAMDLKETSSLGLVDFSILPHYDDRPFEEESRQTYDMYKDELDLVLIDNSQTVTVDDDGKAVIR